ncbi:MAG TPA: class I SAM-dependent methyltransferase [Actinoplanes sp.]
MGADDDIRRLSAAARATGDATGWFERLYAEAEDGAAEVPWDRPTATPLLADWAHQAPGGDGRTALVVGCGLGRDAEFVAGLGFATTAFDISATAVRVARERHPGSPVDYVVADLLDPPVSWWRGFDLVVESNTVQALPRSLRHRATTSVASLVAPGGTLLVLASAASTPDGDGPPWPLTRDEVQAFAVDGLSVLSVEWIRAGDPPSDRWRAVLRAATG